MVVSLRSYSTKVVPAFQVISNLNRKRLTQTHYGLPESKFSIVGLSSRSVFLTQFLFKRNIGNNLSVGILKENENNFNPQMTTSYTIYANDLIHYQHDRCCVNLHSFQPLLPTHDEKNKDDIIISQSGFSREVYFNKGNTYCVSFSVPPQNLLCEYEKMIVLLSESSKGPNTDSPKNEGGKPTPAQLERVHRVLSDTLPKFFVQSMDYSIYHPNLIFENNIRATRTVGLFHYIRQLALLRMLGHLKFAYVKFEILKITSHPEDGTVKVRWRIKGITGMKVFLNFWKFNILKARETAQKESELWYDGFSIFFLDSEGKVYKHIVDKMQPDPEEKAETLMKPSLATKLALIVGPIPRDCLDLAQVMYPFGENSRCLSNIMLPLDKMK